MNNKNETALAPRVKGVLVDETALFNRVSEIIENRKSRAGAYANREVTLMYWEIGQYVNSVLLGGERAEYGKRIVTTLSSQLMGKYGKAFDIHNLRRMMRFAQKFSDFEIVTKASSQLSYSHFIELLPLKTNEARMFYVSESVQRNFGIKELRRQISRKAYERREIRLLESHHTNAIDSREQKPRSRELLTVSLPFCRTCSTRRLTGDG